MWVNRTNSISAITSTVVFAFAIGTTHIGLTSDIILADDSAFFEPYMPILYGGQERIGSEVTDSMSTISSIALQNNLKKLYNISMLKDNWNGNGARAFTATLLEKATAMITSLNTQPEIFPTPVNSLQLEYDGPNDSYLEIEISENKTAEVYRINRNGREDMFTTNTDAETLNRLVNAFYE